MKLVRIYPTGKAFIDGVPAVEQEVPQPEADRLLAYQPPAFTTTPPDKAAAADGDKPPIQEI